MANALKLILFLVLLFAAVIASRHALRARLSYGIHRFIAFVILIVLVIVQLERWFRDPLSASQIVSWVLFAIGIALAAHGIHLLRVVGGARARVVEETGAVVRAGAYRYVRHPMYASLILFAWGVFLKGPDALAGVLAAGATGFLVGTARAEERFNLLHLGEAYATYREHTKMFIPFVI